MTLVRTRVISQLSEVSPLTTLTHHSPEQGEDAGGSIKLACVVLNKEAIERLSSGREIFCRL